MNIGENQVNYFVIKPNYLFECRSHIIKITGSLKFAFGWTSILRAPALYGKVNQWRLGQIAVGWFTFGYASNILKYETGHSMATFIEY